MLAHLSAGWLARLDVSADRHSCRKRNRGLLADAFTPQPDQRHAAPDSRCQPGDPFSRPSLNDVDANAPTPLPEDPAEDPGGHISRHGWPAGEDPNQRSAKN